MLAIYGAIYTLAGMIAPSVMGVVIQHAAVPLDGYMTGFTINAVMMVASGLLGLLLLWPNTERKRLMAAGGGAAEVRVSANSNNSLASLRTWSHDARIYR